MMVGISPVRNSPTIRHRRKHGQLTSTTDGMIHSTSNHLHRYGIVVGCVALVLICLWQTTTTENNSNTAPTITATNERTPPPHLYEAYPSPATPKSNLRSSSKSSSHTTTTTTTTTKTDTLEFDVIVVGSGLAGLTTTLEVLDRGGRVALVEKEATLGGNSIKASSGINACCHDNDNDNENISSKSGQEDTLEAFSKDTTRSAGDLAQPPLIEELVQSSSSALHWLQERVGVDLSQIAQLGGHSFARTHRPTEGMVGAELIVNLEQLIRTYAGTEKSSNLSSSSEEEGHVTIYTNHPVTQLIQEQNNQITGVQVRNLQTNVTTTLTAPQVVLATGGFASDRRPTASLLGKVRPDLISFGTTGGGFSTGDGIALATSVGAHTIDLEQIQLHPTGFINPQNPHDTTKVLAAELLRGVGGLLLDPTNGARFCNELGTRDYVTQQMLQLKAKDNAFVLLLTQDAAQKAAAKHIELYHRKGLLTQIQGLQALADWMNVPLNNLHQTFVEYQSAMQKGRDQFGKSVFNGFPSSSTITTTTDWEQEVFFAGTVTPVLHYCMGGLSIDVDGHVLNEQGVMIDGLYAAGEVAGGVHGKNRLGGNSLLECTVFGRKIGQQLILRNGHAAAPYDVNDVNNIPQRHQPHHFNSNNKAEDKALLLTTTSDMTIIDLEELQKHNTKDDLWMALHGMVFNLTTFAGQHPGGASILETIAGTDATKAFATVHSQHLLQQFYSQPTLLMGKLLEVPPEAVSQQQGRRSRTITTSELKQHHTKDDCWVAFHGYVYDMTEFSKIHKGGAYLIQKYAGKDATDTYKAFHRKEKLGLIAQYLIGTFQDDDVAVDTTTTIKTTTTGA